jgi:hypothetical protein
MKLDLGVWPEDEAAMSIPEDVLQTLKPQRYAAVRKLVKDGDLFLCQGRDPFSKMIQWSTKSPWSHIAIAFRVESLNRVIVIESVEKIGVRAVTLSQFCSQDSEGTSPYPGKIVLARHSAFDAASKVKSMANFAFDHLGCRFAAGEIAKIGFRIAEAKFMGEHHKMPKMLIPDDEFICSEFVAAAFKAAKVTIPWDGLGFIAPADFANAPMIQALAQVDVSKPPRPPKASKTS